LLKALIKIFFIAVLVITSKVLLAKDSLRLIKTIPIAAQTFATDRQGNLYVATQRNVVFRYNKNGDSTGFFSSKRRGSIAQIDAANPLNVLLFHKDIPAITAINGIMNEKYMIDLRKSNVYVCPAVAYSADGDVWVYNLLEARMQKSTESTSNTSTVGNEVHQKNWGFNFQQLFSEPINPIFMTEQERQVFIIDTTEGILRFDQFGNYVNTYHFKCASMQFVNNCILYFANGKLNSYNTANLQEQTIVIPNTIDVVDARIEQGRVFVMRKSSVDIYAIE
jgi:hypothetical protein